MNAEEFLNGMERLVRRRDKAHLLQRGLTDKQLAEWQARHPGLKLPDAYVAFLRKHNGFMLFVNDDDPQGSFHFLPLHEVTFLGDQKYNNDYPWGMEPSEKQAIAKWIGIGVDRESQYLLAINTETGEYPQTPGARPWEPEQSMPDLDAALSWVVGTYELELPEARGDRAGGSDQPLTPRPKTKKVPELVEAFRLPDQPAGFGLLALLPGTDILLTAKYAETALGAWSLKEKRLLWKIPELLSSSNLFVDPAGSRIGLQSGAGFEGDHGKPFTIAVIDGQTRRPLYENNSFGCDWPQLAGFLADPDLILVKGLDKPHRHEDLVADPGKIRHKGLDDHCFRLVNMKTGELKYVLRHTAPISALAISADGRVGVSGSNDGRLYIWDLTTFSLIRELPRQPTEIRCLALTPSADRVVVVSLSQKSARVLDMQTGAYLAQPAPHKHGQIRCVAICPDGERAVTGGDDGYVRLSSLRTGEALAAVVAAIPAPKNIVTGMGLNNVWLAVITSDGRTLLTSSGPDLRAWELPP